MVPDQEGPEVVPQLIDVPPPATIKPASSVESLKADSLHPSISTPEKWMSPLEKITRLPATTPMTINHVVGETDTKMDEEGLSLHHLDRPPLCYGQQRESNSSSPRLPFHGDEHFSPGISQPTTPSLADDGIIKNGIEQTESQAHLLPLDDAPKKYLRSSRSVSFAPSSPSTSFVGHPGPERRSDTGWSHPPRSRTWYQPPGWHPSFCMYLCFLFGIICAVCHHIFYTTLDGKPAVDQTKMLRHGTFLAYAAKAGFAAAVISAFKQRVWVTVRSRFMSISALDAMFAATEDMMAMLNLEFLKDAKAAYALALFAWTTPLVVILSANTLLVVPSTVMYNMTCPGVRTLNFSFEDTNEWRTPTKIDGLFEIPVSLWNTTKRADDSDPDWFDYYTGPSSNFQQTATLGAFLEEVVPRKNASSEICGVGWNCTFTINFTAPGYQCTELASGVGSTPRNLSQESGEAVPPFGTDILLPRGNFSYYAFTSGGEYSGRQLVNVSVGGIPLMSPPYPAHFGALRTEPVIWVGYSVLNHPNTEQPSRNEPGWDDAFTPKIFACEHRETLYVANFTYTDGTQNATVVSHQFGAPIINTTYLPGVPADDGTNDNTSATPEANYIYPNDTVPYRRAAAYHSFGQMLRTFINGTVTVEDSLVQPVENTQAIQTKLLDQRRNYFPYPDLMDQIQGLYEDIILSVFSNPQFVEVVWAARPDEQSGVLVQGGGMGLGGDKNNNNTTSSSADYMYNCTRYRTENTFSYHERDLWLVYGVASIFTLLCVTAGALAVRANGGVTRNTRFSSVVAATRGPALEKIPWMGPLQDRGDVPAEVKRLRLGYGIMTDMNHINSRLAGQLGVDPNLMYARFDDRGLDEVGGGPVGGMKTTTTTTTTYNNTSSTYASEMRCGFALKGDVDQRHTEGSLFHR